MSDLEPRDVGPAVGGDLRASDADRNQVIELLSAAYAEGRLTPDEHGERVELATRAVTFDDLVPLTRDLVPTGVPLPAQEPASAGARVVGGGSPPLTLVGMLGGATRTGRWRVPREITTYAVLGGVDLDFTDAEFEADTVTITAYTLMGGLDLKVPEGVEVRDEGVAILGGSDIKHIVAGDGPTIVLRGVTLCGGVDAHGPARRIAREERREQRRRRRLEGG